MTEAGARWKRFQPRELNPRVREEASRILVALGGAALICLIVWLMRPRTLGRPLNIVAWVTYVDYNFPSAILRYRLEADAFPALAIVIYLLISRWGPLRLGPAKAAVPSVSVAPGATEGEPVRPLQVWGPSRSLLAALARTLPAAMFLGWCARPGFSGLPLSRSVLWLLLATGYVAVTGAAAALLTRYGTRRHGWTLVDWISACNALACPVAAFAGLWWLSHTAAVHLADGSTRHWQWVPLWFSVLGVVAVWSFTALQLKRGRSALWLESRIRVVLLGAVTMYVLVAALAGPLGYLQGFDDSQSMTFARLVGDGYFPWRDFIMGHGPLDDLLQPMLGFALFQNSVWGANAGTAAVIMPLCWVCVYWLGVWVARPGSPFVLVPLVWAASGLQGLDPRFLFVPLTLVLLGATLSRPTRLRLCALTLALFLNALATPESGFVVIGSLVALVATDLAEPRGSAGRLARFPRTTTFVLAGAALTAAWAAFLAAEGALSGFIRYFQFFLSQHTAQSFIPPGITSLQSAMFTTMKLLAVVVILVLVWRVRHRLRLTPLAGVALASAVAAALYGEQAVGRMDVPHTEYSLQVALPLFMICLWWILTRFESLVDLRAMVRLGSATQPSFRIRNWMTIGVVAVFAVSTATVLTSFETAPSRTLLTGDAQTVVGPLGYMEAGAIPPHELTDWTKIIRRYSKPGQPFLDMTDATGYFYYLLRLKPASVFTSLGSALNPPADTVLRNDVKASQPPLVAYSSDLIGLTSWDGVADNVRNYLTSQYVLSHWTPIVKSHGVLFLLRNDLLHRHRPLPRLAERPLTRNLYQSVAPCGWGDAPNFLQSTPVGHSITLSARQTQLRYMVTVAGWAFDQATSEPAREVVIMVGSHVETVAPVNLVRTDVVAATGKPTAIYTGFSATYLTADGGPVSAYALTGDGKLHLLPGATPGAPTLRVITIPGGRTLRVGAPGYGNVDGAATSAVHVAAFRMPQGTSLGSYQLATLRARTRIGSAQYRLFNSARAVTDATITMSSLPISGASLPVRVGTCLQWHGYRGRTLYLAQAGGNPVTSLRLSDVRQ